ncbi:hypothetical protein EVAR_100990_1 [Eumeta japonica]|uniref:Uncharacterized protein n=1 Tax=Eumeta variegata TaxID=151549 RepID=A0A4C2A2Q7_EUMVA|nr:hypothetical protein EVAR_100990_1 [Eumeta japonica]
MKLHLLPEEDHSMVTAEENISAGRLIAETDRRVIYQQIRSNLSIERVEEKQYCGRIFFHHNNISPHIKQFGYVRYRDTGSFALQPRSCTK